MDVKGKIVCVTGVLAGLTRSEAEAGLLALGARVTGSVSKKTDILFVGVEPGSKLAKAEALGVAIAGEGELLALLGKKTMSKAKVAARQKKEERRRDLEAQALDGSAAAPSSLKGKAVVVTGTLSVDRDEIESMIRRAGAKVTGSVSKKTDFLVVGSSAGSKLAKAEALGVPTLTEAQVRAAIAGGAKSPTAQIASPEATTSARRNVRPGPGGQGYSGTPLPKKLGIKEGHRVAVLSAPKGLASAIDASATSSLSGKAPFDVIVMFTRSRADLAKRFDASSEKLDPDGGLWVAWPKKSSKEKTDLTEDVVREIALAAGLVDNKVCAIDETWSGLRCVVRKKDRPKKRPS